MKEKAFILEKLERYEESLNWWRFLVSISPTMEEESLYHRIWILLNLNNAAMAKKEIEAFLTYLATDKKVSPTTQNQAFSAILFLYKEF